MSLDAIIGFYAVGAFVAAGVLSTLELAVSAWLRTGALTELIANLRSVELRWSVVRGPSPIVLSWRAITHATVLYSTLVLGSWLSLPYLGLMLARALGARLDETESEALRMMKGDKLLEPEKVIRLFPSAFAFESRMYDDVLVPHFASLVERLTEETATALDELLEQLGPKTFDIEVPLKELLESPDQDALLRATNLVLLKCNPLNAWELHFVQDAFGKIAEGAGAEYLLRVTASILLGRVMHEGVSIGWFETPLTDGVVTLLALELAARSGLPKAHFVSKFSLQENPYISFAALLAVLLNSPVEVIIPAARVPRRNAA